MLTVFNTDFVEAQRRLLLGITATTTTTTTTTTQNPNTGANNYKIVIAVLSVVIISFVIGVAFLTLCKQNWVVKMFQDIRRLVQVEVYHFLSM